ncbi:hypothetical protein THERMOS_1847 [Bathymodiolus thermophilus thioautotrophic gill symbiont]|uniref:Uncharacterized protein n=1 Tax=Bathymodiolus thermophilus thioautotrophic gill symbiont TaxID=2360 RepID=A0A8H8XE81_9GAMM|nr:hypothetical protein THERMOS_1847 [Bathymodiolus thermophilus thioautotrophic gill symbiont]
MDNVHFYSPPHRRLRKLTPEQKASGMHSPPHRRLRNF